MKLLFIVEETTLAHYLRSCYLYNIVKDDYDVKIVSSRNILPHIDEVDFVESKCCVGKTRFLESMQLNKPIFDYEILLKQVEENSYFINKYKPDMVIGDMRLSLMLNKILFNNFVYVNVTNSYLNPNCKLFEDGYLPMPYTKYNYHFAKMIFTIFKPLFVKRHTDSYNKIMSVKIIDSFLEPHFFGDKLITVDNGALFPVRAAASNVTNIGNIVPSLECSDYNDQFDIFVNLGSSLSGFLLHKIIKTASKIKDLKFLIATLGQKFDHYSNIEYLDYTNNRSLAIRSKLFINNGGIMNVGPSIEDGVNQLCIPHNFDQHVICESLSGYLNYIRSDLVSEKLLTTKIRACVDKPIVNIIEAKYADVSQIFSIL